MRFYQVHMSHEWGVSAGSEFFSSRKLADAKKREWLDGGEDHGADVHKVEVTPTRSGILAALNSLAQHPDNG